MLAAALLILLAGVAIGATGIGGILVVPVLTSIAGYPVLESVAASSCAFLFPGLLALWRRRGEVESAYWSVQVAALLGALVGAVLAQSLPAAVLRGAVAALAIGSGLHAWFTLRAAADPKPLKSAAMLPVLGLIVGCGSALSGTGGPVLMLPMLMLLNMPLRGAIVLAQGLQVPVALAASGVHVAAGRLDVGLAFVIGLLLLAGSWLGYRIAERMPVVWLKRVLALGLIVTGVWYGWNIVRVAGST